MRCVWLLIGLFPILLLAQDFEEVEFYEEAASFRPFGLQGSYINIQNAEVRNTNVENQHVRYIQSEVAFAFTYPCNLTSGLIFGAGWVGTEVFLSENPSFNESCFNYVTLSLGAFTACLEKWLWTANGSIFIDTDQLDFSTYALYQGVLWGKYQIGDSLELDIGFIAEVGLKETKIWPILGFSYIFTSNLRLHAIYPVNVILEYDLFNCLTAGASIRFLRNRHRVGDDNLMPQAIFEYCSVGGEADLIFSPSEVFSIRGFAGTTFGGDLKISNRDNKNTHHYKFKDSFYAGLSATLSF